ncbi:MAG: US12 family protein, partial [Lachnospiraceae bacterium]|nr:US12 family protein [Lachnospiraceae bacterium]
MDNKEMKLKRLTSTDGTPLTEGAYNVTIGLTLLWGLLLNVLTAVFLTPYIIQIDYRIILVGYLVLSFGCIAVVFKSHTPAISFLGFTGLAFVMGVLLTFFLTAYSASSIYSAFLATGIIVLSMMILSMFFPAFFLSLGRVLLFALIGSIVIELIGGLLLHLPLGI